MSSSQDVYIFVGLVCHLGPFHMDIKVNYTSKHVDIFSHF